MSVGLFAYPKQAVFGRILPKTKIYEHTRLTTAMKSKFVGEIEKIVWQFKLAPETLNLPARKGTPEIEVFVVTLKAPEISSEVLRCIDNAIPFPIIYELIHDGRVKVAAAFKRPNEVDRLKWVTDIYFESNWQTLEARRKPLPISLDLAGLYEQLLRELMPVSPRPGEPITDQVARLGIIRGKQKEASRLELSLRNEKQFNRKVAINARLRDLKKEIEGLSKPIAVPNK